MLSHGGGRALHRDDGCLAGFGKIVPRRVCDALLSLSFPCLRSRVGLCEGSSCVSGRDNRLLAGDDGESNDRLGGRLDVSEID